MPNKFSPTGVRITGKLEKVYGNALITDFDENGEINYAGETKINWDSQCGVTTTEAGLECAKDFPDDHVYVDDNGDEWAESQLLDYRPEIKGQFVSVWDTAEIRTDAVLHMPSGEVDTKKVEGHGVNTLVRQYFMDEDGTEYEICPECHQYVLKTVMVEGIGKQLHEEQQCSDPYCPSHGG